MNIILYILLILSIVGLAVIPLLRLLWKSQIESCRFQLFEVRDNLVLLVAKEQLNRDSEIFNYYYRNINEVLSVAEKMHIEDLLNVLRWEDFPADDFMMHRAEFKKIMEEVKSSSEPVRIALKQYYSAVREALLINSNFFSVLYLMLRHRRRLLDRFRQIGLFQNQLVVAKAVEELECESERMGLAAA